MKKVTFTLSLALAAFTTSFAQIANGDMESWVTNQWSTIPTGSGNAYYEPATSTNRPAQFLRTINAINDIPIVTAPLSTFRCDTAHGGNYSANLTTTIFGSYIIPGVIISGDVVADPGNPGVNLGRPYTSRPTSFSSWFQYEPVSGDSAAFEIVLTKWDALNQERDTIGYAKSIINGTFNTWTERVLNITYYSPDAPDSVIIIAASSAGYDFSNLLAGVGQVGSMLLVDDMTFNMGPVSVAGEMINTNVSIYPNPTADRVNITTDYKGNDLVVKLLDMSGKVILTEKMQANHQLDMSGLRAGNYVIVLQDNLNVIHKSNVQKM